MSNEDFNPDYWVWLFKGIKGDPGIYRIVNQFLVIHLIVGVVLAIIVKQDINETATLVLLPLAGIFVGLSFAWASNAQSLIQSDEIEYFTSNFNKGGRIEYVYTFQTAILFILITIVLFGLGGFEVFEYEFIKASNFYFFIKVVLFMFASITLRECWQVVFGSQRLLIIRMIIKSNKAKKEFKK